MRVDLIELEALRREVAQLSKEAFAKQYPGAFLIAMGYLAVEEIQNRGHANQSLTSVMSFGSHRHHDAGDAEPHPLAGLAYFLQPGEDPWATIGRNTQCHIAIPDESVSELHCKLEVQGEGLVVIDVGSTNGTSVNLKQVERGVPGQIRDQDILSVGRYSFQLISNRILFDELTLLAAMDIGLDG